MKKPDFDDWMVILCITVPLAAYFIYKIFGGS